MPDASPPSVAHLLDQIFKDPDTKHGLRVFEGSRVEDLSISLEGGVAMIECLVTGKKRRAKPEEIVRQLTILELVSFGYDIEQMAVEVPIKMGSTYASKKADVVVYSNKSKQTPRLIVELKKPKRTDGLDQLQSYMNATGVRFGAWINGIDAEYHYRKDPNIIETIPRLPKPGESIDAIRAPLLRRNLRPIEDLKAEIQYLENTVLANAGVSTFDEVFKLVFAKLYDEYDKAEEEPVDFRISSEEPATEYARLNSLFHQAVQEWPGIFSTSDNLELSPEALVPVASEFQSRRFFDADLDVIDAAFEYLINPEQKGDKGQYFTPRPVVKMCVRMLNPKPSERIVDPACGPGGFLIHSLHWVDEQSLKPRYKKELAKRKYDYANSRLFGIDFDSRLMRVAKAMMLIAGDGKSNIFRVSSLDPREWTGRSDGLTSAVTDGTFDIVLTNPPFAGSIKQPEVLATYDLAFKGDPASNPRSGSMTRDLLFVERCVRLLKPGGRMAVVLPQGTLNNIRMSYFREWLSNQARLVGVIGLHPNTFKPFTNTKTSVLILQKWREGEATDEYPVFMATNQVALRDSSGRYAYEVAEDGLFVTDDDGNRIIAHDLDDIANDFVEFAREQTLSFWEGK